MRRADVRMFRAATVLPGTVCSIEKAGTKMKNQGPFSLPPSPRGPYAAGPCAWHPDTPGHALTAVRQHQSDPGDDGRKFFLYAYEDRTGAPQGSGSRSARDTVVRCGIAWTFPSCVFCLPWQLRLQNLLPRCRKSTSARTAGRAPCSGLATAPSAGSGTPMPLPLFRHPLPQRLPPPLQPGQCAFRRQWKRLLRPFPAGILPWTICLAQVLCQALSFCSAASLASASPPCCCR